MTTRQATVVRAARAVQRLPLSWLRPLEAPLVYARTRATDKPRMLILLALPRSGSTLTYQCLVHALKPVYLSNLWNLCFALPWAGGCLSARLCAEHQSNFRSDHGLVDGLCGPAEGLRFWSYWAGLGLDESRNALPKAEVSSARISYLRRSLSLLSSCDKPMLTGYLGHILAVEKLREWFPGALFVRLHRAPLSNALSILRNRRHNEARWFSVFPKECEAVRSADKYTQVASQVYWLNRRLDALAKDANTIHVAYEHLCRSPNNEVQRIVDFCNDRGMHMGVRESLPESFVRTQLYEGDNEKASTLMKALKLIETRHGSSLF